MSAHLLKSTSTFPDSCPHHLICPCRHVAAAAGHAEVVRLLLDKSDEDAENSETGNTPLWAAVSGGHKEAAAALIEGGADVNLACEWRLVGGGL